MQSMTTLELIFLHSSEIVHGQMHDPYPTYVLMDDDDTMQINIVEKVCSLIQVVVDLTRANKNHDTCNKTSILLFGFEFC